MQTLLQESLLKMLRTLRSAFPENGNTSFSPGDPGPSPRTQLVII